MSEGGDKNGLPIVVPDKNNFLSKRDRLYNSRKIRLDINDPAFTNPPRGKNTAKKVIESQIVPNKLDIPEFLAAREFEIRTLEQAMIKSKAAGSTRVFQNLPRSMRRRTASHNVKRIPKRMRRKALKEMGVKSVDGQGGTKGVTLSGRPINKKPSRGRLRWRLHRKMKLLKWATKWKLEGNLLSGEWVSAKDMKMGDRIKALRKEIQQLKENDQSQDDEKDLDDSSIIDLEKWQAKKCINNKLQNQTGAYDNTGVNEQSTIHRVSSLKYATRQRHFKWLPTHVWHAKRAKMIKRWNWNIPYEPTQKCFRNTSRSGRLNGCVAQDTSFIGTTIVNAPTQEKLLQFVKTFTHNQASRPKWASGRCAWEGYVYLEDDVNPLGRAILLWSIQDSRTQLIIRSYPSIHIKVYASVLNHFQNDDTVTIHDCKYSIGSISITGPKSITSLQSIFHKRYADNDNEHFDSFMKLFKLNDIDAIPDGSLFSFDLADPRFWSSPILPTAPKFGDNEDILDVIISLRKFNLSSSKLFDIVKRNESYCNQLSNKLLSRRRSLHFGEAIPLEATDASIPAVLYKTQNEWTVMLPWFWVMPFWYTLMQVPHIQLGGLKQSEQLKFERGALGWSDLVFTFDGFIQCQLEKDIMEHKWKKRPKSKRVEYSKLKLSPTELGETLSPYGLDWRGLQVLRLASQRVEEFGAPKLQMKEIKRDEKMNLIPEQDSDINVVVKAIQSTEEQLKELNKHDLLVKFFPIQLDNGQKNSISRDVLQNLCFNIKSLPPLTIVPIKFYCSSVGNVKPNARIYILPEDQEDKLHFEQDEDILAIVGKPQKYRPQFTVPHIKYLVGLVSSSTFNLVEGRSTGIAFVDSTTISKESAPQKKTKLLARNVSTANPVLINWSRL